MDIVSYKCPHCGGELKFDPGSGDFTCDWCRSKFTQEELLKMYPGDQEGEPGGGSADAQTSSQGESSQDGEGKIYSCPSCGAQIMTDATTAATFCYYCHNPALIPGRLTGGEKPDCIIPFEVTKDNALQIFEQWIRSKKYIPDAFYSKDQMEKVTGVYFPFMLYTCRIGGHIDAQGTKVVRRREGDFEVTERSTYRVRRDGDMEVKNITRNALKKANKKLVEGVVPFDMDKVKPFNMSYLSGFQAETRDLGADDFRDEVEQEVRDYAVTKLEESTAGYTDLTVTQDNTTLEDATWKYAMMPVWTLTYKDPASGEIYYFSVNGQTGKPIGELPVNAGKLKKAALTAAGVTAAVVFAALTALWYFL